ncbi:MAG: cobyric acid synthase, partial [Paracoccaceae bacterium]
EGAGSRAQANLPAADIPNMGFAHAADINVLLVGDIDRGGVIAQLVGSHTVLPPEDRDRIKGFVINKFRGDITLFDDGLSAITRHTGWRSLGVVPWFGDAWRLPGEDVMDVASRPGGALKIAVPRLARIANFDDLDPLAGEPGVSLEIIEPGRALPGDAQLVLIPGSKTTIADLADFRANGWDIDLRAHRRRGGHIIGICGGYQMLGCEIADPQGLEGTPGTVPGLGLLDVSTVMHTQKRLVRLEGKELATGAPVAGYEIHIGDTTGADTSRPWLHIDGRDVGAASADGRVRGCYLHGLFASDRFRRGFLSALGGPVADHGYDDGIEAVLDSLASHLERSLDLDGVLDLATEPGHGAR